VKNDLAALSNILIQTSRVEQLEQRLELYEEELVNLRELRLNASRNFTDKSVTDTEYQSMKLKVGIFG